MCSSYFNFSNGVRQGDILSPKRYFIYVDDLAMALSGIKNSCLISVLYVNHVVYADNLYIMSASSVGLQHWC